MLTPDPTAASPAPPVDERETWRDRRNAADRLAAKADPALIGKAARLALGWRDPGLRREFLSRLLTEQALHAVACSGSAPIIDQVRAACCELPPALQPVALSRLFTPRALEALLLAGDRLCLERAASDVARSGDASTIGLIAQVACRASDAVRPGMLDALFAPRALSTVVAERQIAGISWMADAAMRLPQARRLAVLRQLGPSPDPDIHASLPEVARRHWRQVLEGGAPTAQAGSAAASGVSPPARRGPEL
jgi:hypothetical protein